MIKIALCICILVLAAGCLSDQPSADERPYTYVPPAIRTSNATDMLCGEMVYCKYGPETSKIFPITSKRCDKIKELILSENKETTECLLRLYQGDRASVKQFVITLRNQQRVGQDQTINKS